MIATLFALRAILAETMSLLRACSRFPVWFVTSAGVSHAAAIAWLISSASLAVFVGRCILNDVDQEVIASVIGHASNSLMYPVVMMPWVTLAIISAFRSLDRAGILQFDNRRSLLTWCVWASVAFAAGIGATHALTPSWREAKLVDDRRPPITLDFSARPAAVVQHAGRLNIRVFETLYSSSVDRDPSYSSPVTTPTISVDLRPLSSLVSADAPSRQLLYLTALRFVSLESRGLSDPVGVVAKRAMVTSRYEEPPSAASSGWIPALSAWVFGRDEVPEKLQDFVTCARDLRRAYLDAPISWGQAITDLCTTMYNMFIACLGVLLCMVCVGLRRDPLMRPAVRKACGYLVVAIGCGSFFPLCMHAYQREASAITGETRPIPQESFAAVCLLAALLMAHLATARGAASKILGAIAAAALPSVSFVAALIAKGDVTAFHLTLGSGATWASLLGIVVVSQTVLAAISRVLAADN